MTMKEDGGPENDQPAAMANATRNPAKRRGAKRAKTITTKPAKPLGPDQTGPTRVGPHILPAWLRIARHAAVIFAVFVSLVALVGYWRNIPPGDNPFIPLALDHEVGRLTEGKLAALKDDASVCRALLDASSIRYRPVRDRRESDYCGFKDAVRVEASMIRYSSPVAATCPMAAALFLWERDILSPLAKEKLGSDVKRIEHVGTYSCRRVYGGQRGEPSQHATANAIDVIGFTLEDGRVVSVLKHWDKKSDEGRFLEALHKRSCQMFRTVLGPDYNTFHDDHFHIDMGHHDICR